MAQTPSSAGVSAQKQSVSEASAAVEAGLWAEVFEDAESGAARRTLKRFMRAATESGTPMTSTTTERREGEAVWCEWFGANCDVCPGSAWEKARSDAIGWKGRRAGEGLRERE